MFAKFSIRNQFKILDEVNLPAAYSFSDKIKADTVFLAKKHNTEDVFIILYKDKSLTMNIIYDIKIINDFIQEHADRNYIDVDQLISLRDEFLPYSEKYQLEKMVGKTEKEKKKTALKI